MRSLRGSSISASGGGRELEEGAFVRNFIRDLYENPMSAFTGSFTFGDASITSIDCENLLANVSFNVSNRSGAASNTRMPPT